MGERGLTLVELLVVLALMVPVLAVVFMFAPIGGKAWERGAAHSEAQQHARIALEELNFELSRAHYVEVDRSRQMITYRKIVDGKLEEYRAYRSGRQLLLRLPAGTAVPLASGVDVLLVAPDGVVEAGSVVRMTVFASDQGRQAVLRSGVLPRNVGAAP